MLVRRTRWYRIGIALSVIWAIGGGIWGNEIGIRKGDWAIRKLENCYSRQADWAPCDIDFQSDYSTAIDGHWYVAAMVGLGPIPIGWLFVYALVGLWRWIGQRFNT